MSKLGEKNSTLEFLSTRSFFLDNVNIIGLRPFKIDLRSIGKGRKIKLFQILKLEYVTTNQPKTLRLLIDLICN